MVNDGGNFGEGLDVFCDFLHDGVGGSWFNTKREWDWKIDVAGKNFNLINVTIGDGDDIHSIDILDFGGAKINRNDLTSISVILNHITNVVIIIGNDFKATENIFHGVLQGKTNNDTGDTDASKHRTNIDAKELQNDENDNNSGNRANNTT